MIGHRPAQELGDGSAGFGLATSHIAGGKEVIEIEHVVILAPQRVVCPMRAWPSLRMARPKDVDQGAAIVTLPRDVQQLPGVRMSYAVDFKTVSTVGVESSPVAPALAGLRANEARYFKNKYDHDFTVEPAAKAKKTIGWVHRILEEERDIVISSPPLEATAFEVENIRMAYVFYESGLSINVMYTIDDAKKRAVGFKLSDGMEIPEELASRFKFARQKSKLAGTIRGSYFVIKGEY